VQLAVNSNNSAERYFMITPFLMARALAKKGNLILRERLFSFGRVGFHVVYSLHEPPFPSYLVAGPENVKGWNERAPDNSNLLSSPLPYLL
jgi:hypothetical protein